MRRLGGQSARVAQGNGAAMAAGGGRRQPTRRQPAIPRRGLVQPPAPGRPTPGLARPRPERQQQLADAPTATPEQRQLGPPSEGADTPPAAKRASASRLKRYPWYSDDWKEEYRKQVRVTFDFERWKTHRSSARFWRHLSSLVQSNTMQGLAQPMAYVVGVSLVVAAYHSAAAAGWLPLWPVLRLAAVANAPFGFTSFALSLLLVFRTNSSYGRWDEARKMWGQVVNRSRDLVRQGLGYIPPRQADLQSALCRWTVAYSRCLMCHLREGEDLAAELREVLPPEDLEALLAAAHRPSFCCQMLTDVLREAQLPAAGGPDAAAPAGALYRMDENVTVFTDVIGGCERLLRTPIPLAYTRHTSRCLMAWLTLLPLALWGSCGWAMLPTVAVIAFVLLGIEEIGVSIEEPFSILPLENICLVIEASVRDSVAAHCARQAQRAALQQRREAPRRAPAGLSDLLRRRVSGNGSGNGNGAAALPALLTFVAPQPRPQQVE